MEGDQIFKFILVFGCIFHNVICYVKSISTNETTYVMVAFECGSGYWKIPIDVFIADLMLWNDLEIGIDHNH
jgi:hypothetical protein